MDIEETRSPSDRPLGIRLKETFRYFGILGLTSFGGPAAHISIFHSLFVDQLHWLNDRMFSEVFAIGQALPGPGSTQMAFIIALHRNGLSGAMLAFLLWSLPGFILMTALAIFVIFFPATLPLWAIFLRQGFNSVAVGLVAAAGYRLSSNLLKNNFDIYLCWFASISGIIGSMTRWVPPVVIASGGVLKYIQCKWTEQGRNRTLNNLQAVQTECGLIENQELMEEPEFEEYQHSSPILSSIKTSIVSLTVFSLGLIASFVVVNLDKDESEVLNAMKVGASFYITGAIIFGGGPVVIPLLFNYVVQPGWVSASDFLFGLAIINILPGPNFNFGAYCAGLSFHLLLANDDKGVKGVLVVISGALLGYLGIFFPGLSVKVGIMPLWKYVRRSKRIRDILHGVSATAIGLVFSSVVTLWFDAFDNAIHEIEEVKYYFICIAINSFIATTFLKTHPLILITAGGIISCVLYLK